MYLLLFFILLSIQQNLKNEKLKNILSNHIVMAFLIDFTKICNS